MENESQNKVMRTIKSFVLREGRMTNGQRRAMEHIYPKLGVPFESKKINWTTVFDNTNPIILEIGFGMGNSLVEQASTYLENNYLGVEVHRPGVGACLLLAEEKGVENLRVMQHDAVEIVKSMFEVESLSGVQVYFPDPWHKKKHNKRRIIQPEFVRLLIDKMKPGGFFHLATDWENYAEHMVEVMNQFDSLQNLSKTNDYVPKPESRPITKFEKRGQRLGHGVWDLMYVKK